MWMSDGICNCRKKIQKNFQDQKQIVETIDYFGGDIARPICTRPCELGVCVWFGLFLMRPRENYPT